MGQGLLGFGLQMAPGPDTSSSSGGPRFAPLSTSTQNSQCMPLAVATLTALLAPHAYTTQLAS